MNTLTKTPALLLGGLQLAGLGASAQDPSLLEPRFERGGGETHSAANEGVLRMREASHLEVYAGCKWGHAAFDPVRVEAEPVSPEIQALHQRLA